MPGTTLRTDPQWEVNQDKPGTVVSLLGLRWAAVSCCWSWGAQRPSCLLNAGAPGPSSFSHLALPTPPAGGPSTLGNRTADSGPPPFSAGSQGRAASMGIGREEAGRRQRNGDPGCQPAPCASCLGQLDLSHLAQVLVQEGRRGRGGEEGRGPAQARPQQGPSWEAVGPGVSPWPSRKEGRTKYQKVQTWGWGRAGWASRGRGPGRVLCCSSSLSWPPYCVQTEIRLGSHCWSGTELGPMSRNLPGPTARPPGAACQTSPRSRVTQTSVRTQ